MMQKKLDPKLKPLMDADTVNAFLKQVYPQLNDDFADYMATDVFRGAAPFGSTLPIGICGLAARSPARRFSRSPISVAMSAS
jgi:hypothetical protein